MGPRTGENNGDCGEGRMPSFSEWIKDLSPTSRFNLVVLNGLKRLSRLPSEAQQLYREGIVLLVF